MITRTNRTDPTRKRTAPRRAQPARRSRSSLLVAGGAAIAVVAALVIAVLVAGGGDDPSTGESPEAAPVSVDGAALPPLPDSGVDTAVGATFPTLTGTDLDGAPMTIAPDGRPTMIVFLAHWCPHCRADVPVIQDWVDAGRLPAGVELVSVSTAVDKRRPNYPPAEWLAREGWTAPVLDDRDNVAAEAAGLTAFPYFVLVDGDGEVVARASGELTPDQLDEYAALAAGSAS